MGAHSLKPVHGFFHELFMELPPPQLFMKLMNISWKFHEHFRKFNEVFMEFMECSWNSWNFS